MATRKPSDPLVEKHYVSKRCRRQKGMLAFLAQDADTRVFCFANGELRKDQQNDEVLAFVRVLPLGVKNGPAVTAWRFDSEHRTVFLRHSAAAGSTRSR